MGDPADLSFDRGGSGGDGSCIPVSRSKDKREVGRTGKERFLSTAGDLAEKGIPLLAEGILYQKNVRSLPIALFSMRET